MYINKNIKEQQKTGTFTLAITHKKFVIEIFRISSMQESTKNTTIAYPGSKPAWQCGHVLRETATNSVSRKWWFLPHWRQSWEG